MRALVTGSHGFIGKNLVAALRERGDNVICWDLQLGKSVCYSSWLPREGIDRIYHLACVNQEEAEKIPSRNWKVNAFGTQRMAELAKKHDAEFIYTSSCSVYGQATEIPTPTSAEMRPLTNYAVAKLAGEYFVRNSGADYRIYRLSNVYGPHQTLENPYCGVIGRFCELAMDEKPLPIVGSGTQSRDFTFVDDVVDVLLENPFKNGKGRTFNVSSGLETQIYEIPLLLGQFSDKIALKWIPKRTIDQIERRCLHSDFECPTSLSEGLRQTLEWMNERRSSSSDNSGRGSDFFPDGSGLN